ncbi:MAG: hypothetical protein U1F43_31460 [Myxococcota bacterium]
MFQVGVRAAQLLSALQLANAPPPWPVHCHVKGPAPETAVGVPAAHRPELGAVSADVPFDSRRRRR